MCQTAPDKLPEFKWTTYVNEMESKAPTLLRFLMYLVSHSDRRNNVKQGDHHYPAVCMSAAVILKERNREMVSLPTYISLLLFSSRRYIASSVNNTLYSFYPSCTSFTSTDLCSSESCVCGVELHSYLKGG